MSRNWPHDPSHTVHGGISTERVGSCHGGYKYHRSPTPLPARIVQLAPALAPIQRRAETMVEEFAAKLGQLIKEARDAGVADEEFETELELPVGLLEDGD